MSGRMTKAVAIPRSVKEAVARRDTFRGWTCCILCGAPAPSENPLSFSNAHYIPRSKGGLGIEENILTLCPNCHRRYDNTEEREELKEEFAEYLKSFYKNWSEYDLIFKK